MSGVGGNGRRARHTGDDSQLAEKVAWTDSGDDTTLSSYRCVSVDDDQTLAAWCSFSHEFLTGTHLDFGHQTRDGAKLSFREFTEQFDAR